MNANDSTDVRRLDGNVLGGPLEELFGLDLTAATITCAHCDARTLVAAQLVYADAPALVVRCPGCTGVVMRYASDRGVIRFEMTGIRLLTIGAAPSQGHA